MKTDNSNRKPLDHSKTAEDDSPKKSPVGKLSLSVNFNHMRKTTTADGAIEEEKSGFSIKCSKEKEQPFLIGLLRSVASIIHFFKKKPP